MTVSEIMYTLNAVKMNDQKLDALRNWVQSPVSQRLAAQDVTILLSAFNSAKVKLEALQMIANLIDNLTVDDATIIIKSMSFLGQKYPALELLIPKVMGGKMDLEPLVNECFQQEPDRNKARSIILKVHNQTAGQYQQAQQSMPGPQQFVGQQQGQYQQMPTQSQPTDLTDILYTLNATNGKNNKMDALRNWAQSPSAGRVGSQDVPLLIAKFGMDDSKLEGFGLIEHLIANDLTVDDAVVVLKAFSFNASRFKVLRSLVPKIVASKLELEPLVTELFKTEPEQNKARSIILEAHNQHTGQYHQAQQSMPGYQQFAGQQQGQYHQQVPNQGQQMQQPIPGQGPQMQQQHAMFSPMHQQQIPNQGQQMQQPIPGQGPPMHQQQIPNQGQQMQQPIPGQGPPMHQQQIPNQGQQMQQPIPGQGPPMHQQQIPNQGQQMQQPIPGQGPQMHQQHAMFSPMQPTHGQYPDQTQPKKEKKGFFRRNK
ncbi:hypothetical protein P9112_011509 [Eukaryota sp. TZLM1-RC]